MSAYRPGKRMGAASVAHRAGSGDIIGWSRDDGPEPSVSPRRPAPQPRVTVTDLHAAAPVAPAPADAGFLEDHITPIAAVKPRAVHPAPEEVRSNEVRLPPRNDRPPPISPVLDMPAPILMSASPPPERCGVALCSRCLLAAES